MPLSNAIEQQNEAVEIATQIEIVKASVNAYQTKFDRITTSNDVVLSQCEETSCRRLYINAGIVRFIEISPKQLVVQFA